MRFKAEGLPKRHEGTTNTTSKRGRPSPNADASQIEEQPPYKKTRGVALVCKRFKAEGLPKRQEPTTNATSKRGRPLPNSDAPLIEGQLPEKKTRGVAPVYKATGLLTRHEPRTNARMKRGRPYRIQCLERRAACRKAEKRSRSMQ